MKLLFDQNLSPRLAKILNSDFPGSNHVMQVGLESAPDSEVWDYAKKNGYCIISKDSDFGDWAQVFGYPPPLVWLRVGNCSTRDIISKIRSKADQIKKLGTENQPWVLVLW